MLEVPFRFDAERHEYLDLTTGEVRPHATGMLQQGGLIDDRWYTEESCERGQIVHRLTADYDLGAIEDLESVEHTYAGYLQGHAAAMQTLRPEFLSVEEPLMHPIHRYGVRPDRVLKLWGILGTLDVKSGAPHKAHAVQTALQALALESIHKMPAELLGRWGLYLKRNGKWKLERFEDSSDFVVAKRLVLEFC
jgi:hypothetical protein